MAIALTAGFIIGVVSGYVGGIVDSLLMRLVDGILSIPGLLMVMAIVGILGPGLRNAMIGLSVAFTPMFARLVRGQVLSTKSDVYVEARASWEQRIRASCSATSSPTPSRRSSCRPS